MDNIKILMCANSKIYHGLLIATISLATYTKRGIDLYVGTMDLSNIDERYMPVTEEMRAELEAVLKDANQSSRVILCDFGNSFYRELITSKNMGSAYTPYAMIRLFADELPVEDKLLYLDTDVCALGDVSELYDLDITSYHVAGVRDYFGKFFFSPRYINSGVLLMNMRAIREEEIFKKCRVMCRDKRMLLFDQHAINRHAKRKLILPRRYNEQKKTSASTLIRHFAMTIKWFPYFHTEKIKPWQPDLVRSKLHDNSIDEIITRYESIIKTKKERLELK